MPIHKIEWVNAPKLLKESVDSKHTSIPTEPLAIFVRILAEVAERASRLNDPEMNALMCRLALYEIADPYNANYDQALCEKTIQAGSAVIVPADPHCESDHV